MSTPITSPNSMRLAPHRLFDYLAPLLVAVVLAAPITYLEVAHPSLQQVSQALSLQSPSALGTQPKSTSSGSSHAATTPHAAAPATSASKTALTTSLVHLRSAKSVSSPVIAQLNAGTTVQLRDDADATWQGVVYQGKTGYIYRAYLQY